MLRILFLLLIDLLGAEVKLILEILIENEGFLVLNKLHEDSRFFAWSDNEVCWWKRLQIKWITFEYSEVLFESYWEKWWNQGNGHKMNFNNELMNANFTDEYDDALF